MAFYVPLGPRGVVFRIGTLLIGLIGSTIYRRGHRRRRAEPSVGTSTSTPTATDAR